VEWLVIVLVPNLGPLAAFVRHSSILCRSNPATYARLVAPTSGEVMLPRTAEPRWQIISRSCTEERSACANLSWRGRFRLNTADPILEREPPSAALGAWAVIAVDRNDGRQWAELKPFEPDTIGQWPERLRFSARQPLVLWSRHVWPRPPLLRRQRDQTRLLDPARAPDAEFSAELERGADRHPARRALRHQGRTAQPRHAALGPDPVLGQGPQGRLRQYQRKGRGHREQAGFPRRLPAPARPSAGRQFL
jgi:hypothetical protein